jgi:hypothetical protein
MRWIGFRRYVQVQQRRFSVVSIIAAVVTFIVNKLVVYCRGPRTNRPASSMWDANLSDILCRRLQPDPCKSSTTLSNLENLTMATVTLFEMSANLRYSNSECRSTAFFFVLGYLHFSTLRFFCSQLYTRIITFSICRICNIRQYNWRGVWVHSLGNSPAVDSNAKDRLFAVPQHNETLPLPLHVQDRSARHLRWIQHRPKILLWLYVLLQAGREPG